MKWYQHIFGDADSRAKYAEAKRQVKTDKNGKPLTLNARQRAYRAGMLQHSQDNAKCYNAKK